MRITFFGLTISSSWGNGHATPYRAILRALRRRGHHCTFYEKDVPYYAMHGRRDFAGCDYCDLVLYDNWESVRRRALAEARDSDVVVCASYCPEGARIIDEVLALGSVRPLKVFYDLDTPITLGRFERGEQVEYLRSDQLRCFDLVLSFTGGRILEELERTYKVQLARPLYGCVDPDVYVRVHPQPEFACDLSYMGTYAADRQAKLERYFLDVARHAPERTFLLAGSMYPGAEAQRIPLNVKRREHVAPHEHPALYSSSRVTLNITRSEMAAWGYCPSGRFFEAAACGTPIVTDWWEGLESFFDLGRELAVADGSDDVARVLQMDDDALLAMAQLARERTLDEHTGERRAIELLAACEEARDLLRDDAGDKQMEAAS